MTRLASVSVLAGKGDRECPYPYESADIQLTIITGPAPEVSGPVQHTFLDIFHDNSLTSFFLFHRHRVFRPCRPPAPRCNVSPLSELTDNPHLEVQETTRDVPHQHHRGLAGEAFCPVALRPLGQSCHLQALRGLEMTPPKGPLCPAGDVPRQHLRVLRAKPSETLTSPDVSSGGSPSLQMTPTWKCLEPTGDVPRQRLRALRRSRPRLD
ncbi:hypothetical protein BKA67DRAFT_118684 [Truncatella angustata]|uniref:Uncharacterized protein n=1 Tax=Truncatella angustata TaxID=152316 RepID=A0A9P8U8V1_9PEZI|nr:uncharacterized protein BKA67DRAFT_118684 [Truncatella angustata]KAH6645589.1 hypothetical protein BKA67DRAFT_118684 [Truncatella angustata]